MTVSCVFQCSWLVFLYLFHLHCSFADPCSDKVPWTNKTRIGIFELQWGATLLHISRSRYAALYEEWQTLFKFLRMGKRLGWSWDPSSAFRENESKKESKKEKIKKTSARSEDSPRKVSRKTLETEIMTKTLVIQLSTFSFPVETTLRHSTWTTCFVAIIGLCILVYLNSIRPFDQGVLSKFCSPLFGYFLTFQLKWGQLKAEHM